VALELALSLLPLRAAELRVAVASNFAMTLRDVAAPFEERSGHDVVLIAGSTGKLYAQIVHGAPFDVFFAADAARPRQLEKDSRIVAGSRFVYARGTLVLWSADSTLIDGTPDVLRTDFDRLAIANPDLAPYGRAGLEVLDALGLRDRVAARLVQGENVAQTFQFVSTGNAALGFVAASQVFRLAGDDTGSMWVVPDSLHAAIEQQAVLLRDSDVGRAFLTYCRSTEALRILRRAGYDAP
jgi:molybdate transport system substrate-binding protein